MDWAARAVEFAKDLGPTTAEAWAELLGLPPVEGAAALRALGCGRMVDGSTGWATFPMRDGQGRGIGIRRRRMRDGRKLTIKGGHEGLFIPGGAEDEQLIYVLEGPTDTAAALVALRRPATIGRPSCSGGTTHLEEWIKCHRTSTVVLVPDADVPGIAGARACAVRLCRSHKDVRLASPPPAKDLRAFLRDAGRDSTQDWLAAAASKATRFRLGIQLKQEGR